MYLHGESLEKYTCIITINKKIDKEEAKMSKACKHIIHKKKCK